MPSTPDRPSEPSDLHRAFSINGDLDWGDTPFSTADVTNLHGAKATWKSLRILEQALAVEPNVTADFLAALPPTGSAYQLNRRVKSPESLARKVRNWQRSDVRRPIDDVLRYTVVTETPDELVHTARRTTDELTARGWRTTYAMHSYTDGSRYKGIHAYLRAHGIPRIEVQFHSVASARVKELTTPWYEIERSTNATDAERTVARLKCVEASAQLRPPAGIDDLTMLGGRRVAINNYSDSRAMATDRACAHPGATAQSNRQTALLERNDGTAR